MTDEPVTKKIKLSLEPFLDNDILDITNSGQEIPKTETSLPEKLMQSVDRIWFERGEWKDISEESLKQSIKNKDEESKQDEELENENAFMPPPGFDINKLRDSVINKLFHAKSEIDVALDVINILAASSRASATVKDLVLPVGSLTATYVTKPKPTIKAQLESVQLNLGLKRKKQKQASEFLKNSAASLKKIVEKDQVYWEEALDLRRNNWQMQANPQHGGVHAGSSFFVQYGFTDVGSDFIESSVGELKRSDDESNQPQMSLPHGTPRKMAVRIHQSHMGKLGLEQKEFSEGILGMNEEQDRKDQEEPIGFNTMIETKHSEIQNQLAEAYSTVFDAELFSDILAEAQALNSNVKFPDDEIVINIDGQIDLTISKIPMSQTTSNQGTAQHIIGRSIDLAFRLLLLQHQRYHVWKTKARLLSHSHKIKQLVSQQDQPQPTLPVTTASPISNPPSTPTNTTPNPVATPTLPVLPTLPKHIPVLLPILALTRFWVQFDRVRHAVHKLTRPFRYAGFSIKTHFKFLNQQPKVGQDVYPGYGELALSLGISLFKGPSLHFGLSQSGSITVCLSQTTVVLQNVSEFETFLSREIKVMCLLTVCSVANPWIRQTKEFIKASSTDQQSFLWQLDQVDEAIHGSVFCHDQWRTITTRLTLREPSYYLEFNLNPTSDLKQKTYQIEIGEANKEVSALNFKERIAVMIKNIMKDASH